MTVIADPKDALTPRQLELVALYASGNTLEEIASTKFLATNTVRQTLRLARERVGALSLTHLCVICMDSGVIRKNGVGYKPVQEERVVGE
jgi:DNA-binding CsgD family transcriptional regulator